jgi:hypothetical protein
MAFILSNLGTRRQEAQTKPKDTQSDSPKLQASKDTKNKGMCHIRKIYNVIVK